ncbi:MAG: sulfurtransferase TusA family protein [Thermodesulfovibrionales bacterium]|nr:sulfurtransferase TusA family protein [Thermodesulfovibrionales bacterium]
MNNHVLDIRGQICPACLLTYLKELNNQRDRLKKGEIELVVLTDRIEFSKTIPKAAIAMGYSVNIEKREGYYEITIGKRK